MPNIIRPRSQRRKMEDRFDRVEDVAARHGVELDRIREGLRETEMCERVRGGLGGFHGFGPGHKLSPGKHRFAMRNGEFVELTGA